MIMPEITAKIKRGWWLYKSAGLNLSELFNLFLNKIIYFSTWFFYSLRSFFYQGRFDMIAGYSRHIPESFPPDSRRRALLAYLPYAFYKENFIGKIKYYFSNNGCPLAMGRALNETGYVVDILGSDDFDFQPKEQYDVAIFHNVRMVEHYKKILPETTTIIYFEVVAYWRQALARVQRRYDEFVSRHPADVLPMGTGAISENRPKR